MTNPDEELVFTDVIQSVRNVFVYLIYLLLYLVAYMTALLTARLFSPFPYYDANFSFRFIGFFFKFYLEKWFSFPKGSAPDLGEIPGLIGTEISFLTTDLYLLTFQILFVISCLYALRTLMEHETKYNLVVIGCLILMIVIPLVIFGFRDMLRLFTLRIPYFEDLENPVDPELTKLPLNDFFQFMASPIALFAIIAYIYLEVSFQIEYTDIVTKPSLERGERLEAQIRLLQKESYLITASADKIKEEAKKIREEMEITQDKESISGFFARAGQRFSYVKEMIEKRKLEEEEKKLVTAASKTRRLGRYIDRLFKEDPEARDTITAKSSAPKAQSLAISTAFTFAYRVGILILLSFIIIHPKWFFVNVFNLPPAITESVAMYSPEVVITLLIPFMLLFPVISYLISYVKHRNLIIRLKQEGRIKEILASVGDYVKKTEEEEEEEIQEETPEEAISSA
ncbi:MAG: hypothetical protein ACTSR8_01450 [Promethearchaeota archaeon]